MVFLPTLVALCALSAISIALPQLLPPNAPNLSTSRNLLVAETAPNISLSEFNSSMQLLKRGEDAGVKLYTWEQLKCPGDPTEKHELTVGDNKPFKKEIRAYKLSRQMTRSEHLDFSQTNPNPNGDLNDKCGLFVEMTNPVYAITNSPPEVLQKQTCYHFAGDVSAQCVQFHY